MRLLTKDEITGLLKELGAELVTEGRRAELFLVGGAAMALAYDTRRSTRDLAAVFEPKSVVYRAAARIGAARNLPEDWLNDGVKGFLPGEDPNAVVLLDHPGITVRVASPPYLFAMKAMAARVERDATDLLALYRLCGFASVEEALDCISDHYPPHLISPRTGFLVRELLG
ncbi:DUF6036 family nucleotidyltransferase [Stackebrandtia albiflava]|uniref:DUF6036 family nucleotidyltransferase n=1 Tax=Stackebrandtia albiflava TaxID=406432 RepID=UPI0011BE003E|nr:DUF6036 family nucleotidyltransferase [Stackebrandtia albiflava]